MRSSLIVLCGSLLFTACGNLDGIVAVSGLAREVTLLEPNDPPTTKVDRWQHVEGPCVCHRTMLPY